MRLLPDSRGQSVQIGAVLLFGILIILLSTWQAFVIPNQNEGIEFNHNGEVQQQMTDLRSTVLSMPGADTTQSVTVDLGLRYPSRTIFRNPPPVSGTLRTLDTGDPAYNVTIANAEPRNGDLAQLWNQEGSRYNTGAIEYQPAYNQYQSAPRTIYAHSVLYNVFDRENQQLPVTGQSLVRGDEISLVALNGSLSETRVDSASVDFEPVSTETKTVELTSDGGPITLEIPTRLNQSRWEQLFSSERTVDSVTVDQSAVPDEELGLLRVELANGPDAPDSYTLTLAKVGLGTAVTPEGQQYVTDVAGNGSVVQTGETQALTVEVRNRFNKPLSGAAVRASAEGGVFSNDDPTVTAETTTDGQVTLQYTGNVVGENAVNVTIESFQPTAGAAFDATTPTNLTMTVDVEAPPSSGSGGGGSGAYNVTWLNPSGPAEVTCSSSNPSPETCTIDANATSYDLDLTMGTDPTVDGASVEYAVSNRTVGTIGPDTGTTDSNGQDTTTLSVTENGTINTYVNSGSSGDRIEFTVKNITQDDSTAPTISSFQATNPSGTTMDVSFDSDERLSTIDVGVTNDSGYSVNLTSFTETNNGDGTYTYTESVDVGGTGSYDAVLNVAEDDAGNDGASGQRETVIVTKPGLFTAVSPDPNDGTGDSTEFVRIKFPADNTTGWQIEAGSDGDTVDITSDLNGELYLAQNRQDFIERWGIDESKVASTELSGLALLNGGENLLLKDASGVVRDEFGYEGEQTSNGWDISLGSGQVAVRKTEAGGAYQDTNSAADWRIEDEETFFDGESPPGLTSVTVEKAPLNQSDTGASLDVTLTFNKTMDSGIDPTVGLGGLASSGNYNSSLSSGTWSNDDTTWTSSFTLNDDNEEVTSTIEVTGAESQFGTTMSRNTSNSVVVDTKTPTVQRFDLTNPSGTTFQVEIESDEALSEISVDVKDSTGSIVTTLTRSDFSEAQSGTTFTYTESYTASSGGEYTAVLNTARDSLLNDGASDQTDTASTNAPPNAQFSFGPTDPLTGEQINFDGSGSNDPDGSIASYEWDWTDDGTYDDTGQMPTHTYSDSGTYTVRLRVTDDDGTTSTTTQSVTVTPRPTLSSKIVDQGQTGSGSLARYETSYNVTNRSVFDRVEVTYNNLDSGGADQTYTRTDPRTNVDGYGWTDTYGGTGGDTYEVTIEVFDTSGAVVDSRTVTDDADGSDPAGNADLSEASSPQLSNRAIQDTSKNSNANYDVNYTVSDSAGRFTETEILFYNRDTATATGQKTGTQLTEVLSYSAGGAEGDTYDIIIQVQDDDGIVVDSETITDVADGTGFAQPGIVFAGKSNGKLSTIDSEGRVARSVYGVTGTTAAGPQTTDFDSDNSPEVPFKNGNGELGIVDINGNKEILVDTNYGPGINDARLAVGTVFVGSGNSLQTNGGPFVYFINGNGKLTRVDNSGTVTVVEARNANTQGNGQELISAQSVAGTGDIDGDSSAELVFVDSNGKLDYLDERGGKATTDSLSGSPTLNTPNAVGAPADFDGDGAAEIPYINGNKEIKYVNGPDGTDTAGSTTTLATGAGGEYPVGVADLAGGSTPEVVYVDTSGNQRLAYAGTGGISGFIKDFTGSEVPAKTNTGAS